MSTESIMGYAAMFFGILGSWGLYKQASMIWLNKSTKSVSGTWIVTYLAMFIAFLTYGLQQNSFPMEFQGWLRVGFSVPVTLGFFIYGKINKIDWVLIPIYILFLIIMSLKIQAPLFFTAFSFLGIFASFVQAYTVWKNRFRGLLSVELQLIYLLAVISWTVYGIVRKDIPLIIVSVGFVLSYSSTIFMWLKYPKQLN